MAEAAVQVRGQLAEPGRLGIRMDMRVMSEVLRALRRRLMLAVRRGHGPGELEWQQHGNEEGEQALHVGGIITGAAVAAGWQHAAPQDPGLANPARAPEHRV